jgi:uncharacterized protein
MRRVADDLAAKPIDLGTGRVCASFARDSAAWLSVGATHLGHGFVELSGMPPFDESNRGDPVATRAYRMLMTDTRYAFVRVTVDGAAPVLRPAIDDVSRPQWRGAGISVIAHGDRDGPWLRQRWSISPDRARRNPLVRIEVGGRIDRPALAEITEVDPPAPIRAGSRVELDGGTIAVSALPLTARARIAIRGARVAWRVSSTGHVAELEWPDVGSLGSLEFVIQVGLEIPGPPSGILAADPRGEAGHADRLTACAIAYVRGCTSLWVAGDERAILTDHRILPLSWTRDAYWQALLMLVADGPGDRDRVADHLRWLWRRCERPDGRWVRSHHADGRRKDGAFQADQQLYPIVELADFWRVTGGLPGGIDWTDAVAGAWSAALAEADPHTRLIASAETAADDPATSPFIAASQILLWYCAARLAELADHGVLAIDVVELRHLGGQVQSSFEAHLGGADGWAYATDGAGTRVAYHDANDLPVALAPLWGFCDANDPGWLATMRFAFSTANPGFVAGDRSGLGSAHTPGPWTLGDLQNWIVARVTGDEAAATAALERMREVSFMDGMLPEAYAGAGPLERIRHWFAWPGAALGALRLLDADPRGDGLRRLRASR